MAQPNGGWEWSPGWGTDTNSTALAIQALIAAGEPITSSVIISAVNYLQAAQNTDGGFPYDPNSAWGTDSDANSTAYVVQALQAIKQNELIGSANFGAFVLTDTKAISFLLGMQLADGSFEWQSGGGSNLLATQQAIPALLRKAFPFKIRDVADSPAVYLPLVLKNN
jgi:prenyltransferase beta subunit